MKSIVLTTCSCCLYEYAMKLLFCMAMSITVLYANATTYYVSADGSDGNNGTSMGSPWQSIIQVNTVIKSLGYGDQVLFRRGDTFYGMLNVPGSGVMFDAYGSGNKPIITGLTTLSFTSIGGNLWQASCNSGAFLNLVTVGNIAIPMGRYPNSGYLTVDSHNGLNQFTGQASNSNDTNWTGATAVIRTTDYTWDRCLITNHSGTIITYTAASGHEATNGNGYFFQNDIKTLDSPLEWYYNPATHLLTMYNTTDPTSLRVKAATADYAINSVYRDDLTFQNIQFIGQDSIAIRDSEGKRFAVIACDFDLIGTDALVFDQTINTVLRGNTINHTYNTGIRMVYSGLSKIVSNNIQNCGLVEGMGLSNNQQMNGIYVAFSIEDPFHPNYLSNDSIIIDSNIIKRVGYCGITFSGQYTQVRYNYIDSFAMTVTDGGGIYTHGNTDKLGRVVAHNIIDHSIGNHNGTLNPTPGGAAGIYIDDYSKHVLIYDNTIRNATRFGVYLHNNANITASANKIFNPDAVDAFGFVHDGAGTDSPLRYDTVFNNQTYTRLGSAVYWQSLENDRNLFGLLDSNYYARAEGSDTAFHYTVTDGDSLTSIDDVYSFTGWKSASGYDLNSTFATPASDSIRMEYNATFSAKVVNLGNDYKDLKGVLYPGQITLPPFTSAILIKQATNSNSAQTVYRINAGGGQVTTSLGVFSADQYFLPAPGNTATTTAQIAGTTDDNIYQSERFGSSGILSYAVPVSNGSYTVVLHFAENFWNYFGARVFDVSIEGNKVLDNFDIYAKVQNFTATTETFQVTVSDGTLNIDFSSLAADGGVNEPKVNAIEIIKTFPTVYRINAGGGQVTTSLGVFSADQYFSPVPGNTATTTAQIAGTTDDNIYQSERFGSSGILSYAVPVSNGSYTVVLHFAENFWNYFGARVFDVSIEGNKVLDNFDIYAKVQNFTATTETFQVTVSDGTLNIDFSSLAADGGVNEPKVDAIEIIDYSGSKASLLTSGAIKKSVQQATIEKGAVVQKLNITALPNPSESYFKLLVKSSVNKPVNIKIYNSAGRLMEVRTNVASNNVLQLGSNYQAGVYYAEIFQGNEKSTIKLIKQ